MAKKKKSKAPTDALSQLPAGTVDGAFDYVDELAAQVLRDEGFFDVMDELSDELMGLCGDVTDSVVDSLPDVVRNVMDNHPDFRRLKVKVDAKLKRRMK